MTARRLLVVTAVPAEASAIVDDSWRQGPGHHPRSRVVAGGVGPAAAAATTGRLLAEAQARGEPYHAVISAGIAGGFTGRVPVGGTVLGTRSVAADLGADSTEGFLTLDELGFGTSTVQCGPDITAALRAALPGAVLGDVLTVSTVTGTALGADDLLKRWPDAIAEAMEGFGVATAAAQAGIGFAEVRTISNPVGPRDREAWRMGDALAALTIAGSALASLDW